MGIINTTRVCLILIKYSIWSLKNKWAGNRYIGNVRLGVKDRLGHLGVQTGLEWVDW